MFNPPRRDPLPVMYQVEDPILDWDTEHSKTLWAGVMVQAIKDVWGIHDSFIHAGTARQVVRDEARMWFMRLDTQPTSFLWICDQLQFDPDEVRACVLAKKLRAKISDPIGRITQLFTQEMACRRRKATSTGPRTHAQPTPSSA